jgi:hypothetical protein
MMLTTNPSVIYVCHSVEDRALLYTSFNHAFSHLDIRCVRWAKLPNDAHQVLCAVSDDDDDRRAIKLRARGVEQVS